MPGNRRKKETAAQNAVQRFRDAGSGQLPVQPVGNVGKHFLLVRFHQQLVPGTGVQLAFNVLHSGVFQAVDVFALAKLHKERLESLASLREWP